MNKAITIFWLVLSFFLIIFSYREGLGRMAKPGPGLAPFLMGVLLLLFSFLNAYFEIVARRSAKSAGSDKPSGEQGGTNLKKIGMVFISLFLYALLLDILGFIICTFLLLFVMFCGLGVKKLSAGLTSAISSLVCYFLFTYLGMRFPPGILRLIGL
jgi:putative tricarboxylic transport membrane protein